MIINNYLNRYTKKFKNAKDCNYLKLKKNLKK